MKPKDLIIHSRIKKKKAFLCCNSS